MFTATEMWVLEWPMAPRGHLLFVVCLTCATLSGWYRHDTCIMLKFEVLSHIHKLWWVKAKQAILRLWNGLIRFIDNSFNPTFRYWKINQMKSPKNVVFKTSIQQRSVNRKLLNAATPAFRYEWIIQRLNYHHTFHLSSIIRHNLQFLTHTVHCSAP